LSYVWKWMRLLEYLICARVRERPGGDEWLLFLSLLLSFAFSVLWSDLYAYILSNTKLKFVFKSSPLT
jgi:hypothetical protein